MTGIAFRRRRVLAAAAVATGLAASFTAGFELRLHARAPAAASPPPPGLAREVLADLRGHWYRQVPPAAARAGSVKGMLRLLHDPYTSYLPPVAYGALERGDGGSYSGVGLGLAHARRGLVVTRSLPGFPAEQAGIVPGDVIIQVDGAPLASLPYGRAVGLVLGRPGTRVTLRVLRPGRPGLMRVTLVRRSIVLPAVSARTLHEGTRRYLYVRLTGFPRHVGERVRSLARRAVLQHVAGLVLDLRGNPGGLLSEGVAVARVFIAHGVIVSVRGLHQPRRVYRATGAAAPVLPLAVLTDGGTASAAEVVAGALERAGRAVVLGRRTYGKGTVQAVYPLSDGGALKVTAARFLLRGGAEVDGRGIRPTVVTPARGRAAVRAALAALAGR